MAQPQVWLFGNPDYQPDTLPLKIAPLLRKELPQVDFTIKDPNEEWDLPNHLIIVDTVKGINQVTPFTSLDDFTNTPRLTMHDFDLFTNLKWLAKLNQLPPFLIIGLPPQLSPSQAALDTVSLLRHQLTKASSL